MYYEFTVTCSRAIASCTAPGMSVWSLSWPASCRLLLLQRPALNEPPELTASGVHARLFRLARITQQWPFSAGYNHPQGGHGVVLHAHGHITDDLPAKQPEMVEMPAARAPAEATNMEVPHEWGKGRHQCSSRGDVGVLTLPALGPALHEVQVVFEAVGAHGGWDRRPVQEFGTWPDALASALWSLASPIEHRRTDWISARRIDTTPSAFSNVSAW